MSLVGGEPRRGARGEVRAGAVAAALGLCLGCAGALAAQEPPGPPPFQALSTLVLVRWSEHADRRPKDALDAVQESLAAEGRGARSVDLGDRAQRDRGLEALYRAVEARVLSPADPAGPPGTVRLGREVAAPLRSAGVDGAVLYYRSPARLLPPPSPLGADLGPAGGPAGGPPAAALALVDLDGNLVWFGWGGAADGLEPRGPANAAEAVDALLRVIAGEPGPDEG